MTVLKLWLHNSPWLRFLTLGLLWGSNTAHAASDSPGGGPPLPPSPFAGLPVSPGYAPITSLGPEPSFTGPALHAVLDIFGPTLYTFNATQQEILLLVMNATVSDVTDDELQLLAVEELLPLSGPSSVSVFGRKQDGSPPTPSGADAPSGSRKLLAGPGRMLLQILAQSGNSSNLSTLAHLQATVRISTPVQDMDKIRGEIVTAVNGPMLPELRLRGLDAEYLRLASLQVENDNSSSPVQAATTHNTLPHYAIGLIVAAAAVASAGLLLGLIWHRRRRLRARALGKGHTSMKGSSADGTEISQQSDRLAFPFVGPQPGPSPPQSAVSSLNSIPSKSSSNRETGDRKDTSMWNVPLSELQFSRVIGEGSFGKVYLGKWQETTVAIKILTSPGGPLPDDSWDLQDVTQLKDCSWSTSQQGKSTAQRLLIEELTKESSLMASLRHPNIVLFLGVSLEPPCMLTEFCARGSLLDVLHRARTNKAVAVELDWRRRLRLALDAAKGMHYLHTRQPPVLHRDLKSANLLVDKHWQAKVADFNLSRVMQPSAAVSSLAATNPRWLPPEVLSGNDYNSSADVYAFGIILWEMLTWEVPWENETPWQVVISVVDHNRRPDIDQNGDFPGGVPAASQQYLNLMKQCWATKPTDRPTYEAIISHMRSLIDAEDAIAREQQQKQFQQHEG